MATTIRKFKIVSAASALVIFEAVMNVLETMPKNAGDKRYLVE